MLVSGVQNLFPTIPRQGELHQALDAVRPERRLDPPTVAVEHTDRLAGELPDREDAFLGQDSGLTSQAVVEPARRSHVEGRRFLVVEGAQPLEAAAPCPLELEVLTDDLVDPAAFPDQRDVGRPDLSPAGHQAALAAAARRPSTNPSQSRKTWWRSGSSPTTLSVGWGFQRPVVPLSATGAPSMR